LREHILICLSPAKSVENQGKTKKNAAFERRQMRYFSASGNFLKNAVRYGCCGFPVIILQEMNYAESKQALPQSKIIRKTIRVSGVTEFYNMSTACVI